MITVQKYVIDYSNYFKTLSNKRVNEILEALMDNETLDLTKIGIKIKQDNSKILLNINDLKIKQKMKNFLFKLAQLQDVSHLIILNTLLLKWFNNNQLRSLKIPFQITDETFEMYSSIINSITFNINKPNHKTYCSMFPDIGSIGKDIDLYNYIKDNNIKNPKIIINPPFTPFMIKRAIKNIKKILTLKTKSLYLYITVPLWQEEDYQKGGIYHYLMKFNREIKDYQYINPLTERVFKIKTSVFTFQR